MLRNSFFALCFVLLVSSCAKRFDNQEEIQAYIQDEDNGYFKVKQIQDYQISLLYKPTELMLYDEIRNKSGIVSNQNYDKFIYLVLSYSKNNNEILSEFRGSKYDFETLQNHLSFEMNRYVSLTGGKGQTIDLIDYNYSRTYGMSKSTNLLFVFDREDLKKDSERVYFTLSDIGIGIGDLTFSFDTEVINKTTL